MLVPNLAVEPEMLVLRYPIWVVRIENNVRPVLAIERHTGLVDEVATWRNRVNGFGIHLCNGEFVGPLVGGLPCQAIVARARVTDVDVVDALLFAEGVGTPYKREMERAIHSNRRVIPVGIAGPWLLL